MDVARPHNTLWLSRCRGPSSIGFAAVMKETGINGYLGFISLSATKLPAIFNWKVTRVAAIEESLLNPCMPG
ncbi:hypothetical protein KFL_015510010 [Klebsormidium nitens]|uniref:Uncharacterized protein n=1 Tax=Klebsormidium nitens TaxID=105231 RepID=A0A1Y1IS19_KLENI|nr:hypothetical protein KFL_015510010 [Klebsormidium nitens]|eukprot:GAQ93464.1 hypothetical protein KFL_015510010 [Klebsormidium nitens]